MVQVNQINELAQAMGSASPGEKTRDKSGGFENALSQALDQAESSEGETKARELGEINPTAFHIETLSSIVSGKTDKLLDLLDKYRYQLGNPALSLKKISPVLEQINKTADNLLKETQSLGEEESSLKEIANRTVVAARTEYMKFQRGDYLA